VIVFVGDTEFYRSTLGISYELGSRLRRLGVLVADAEMKDGRPLFLLEAESIERHKAAVKGHRLAVKAARAGVRGSKVSPAAGRELQETMDRFLMFAREVDGDFSA
jgi:hypothetical protein